jgi:hypothetical protein
MPQPSTLRLILNAAALAAASPTLLFSDCADPGRSVVKNCEKKLIRSSEDTGFRSGVIFPLVTPSSQDVLVNRRPTTGAGVGAGGAALIPLFAWGVAAPPRLQRAAARVSSLLPQRG